MGLSIEKQNASFPWRVVQPLFLGRIFSFSFSQHLYNDFEINENETKKCTVLYLHTVSHPYLELGLPCLHI